MPVFTLLVSTLILPLFAIALLWFRARTPRMNWIATLVMATGLVSFSFFAAPWGWFGIPMRYGLLLLFLTAVVMSWRRTPRPVDERRPESPLRMVVKLLIGVMFGTVALGVLRSGSMPPNAIDLQFPLRNGSFLVQHGGSESASNTHFMDRVQRFGVDIVKLNAAGTRASGLYPKDLTRYAIYGAEVLSPCDGVVISRRDGLPDNRPGVTDEKQKDGNHVVVRCGDTNVMLAHLQNGSVAVQANAKVAIGTPLGRVGNSGNTREPHLHVHAERAGNAVAATFEGKWLVRNDIVRR